MPVSENRFAFLIRKQHAGLDASFYTSARSFSDVDDDMWPYLLGLVSKGPETHGKRVRRFLEELTPKLRRYFLIRWFDSEWGSEGIEGVCTDEDWFELQSEIVEAFESIGAAKHSELIRGLIPVADAARDARTEKEQNPFVRKFKTFDRQWDKLSNIENLGDMLFADIKADFTPYLHPAPPKPGVGPNGGPATPLAVRKSRQGRHR
jgi:hypothetical protein